MFREKKDSDWSCQSLGFILSWIKLANSGILEQGENFAVMWIMSMDMCCTHRGGRLLQFVLKLTELAPCNASILTMQAEIGHD